MFRRLRASGHEAVAFSGSLGASVGSEIVRWDALKDWESTADALRQVEVIVHAGARIPRDQCDPAEASRCFEVNSLGTLNLLRASERAGVRRFIYVSGANVLSPRLEFVREDDPVGCEHSPYYLGSKVLGEIYVRAAMARGLDGLIVRPSSIYGPGMRAGVIWNFAERIRNGVHVHLKDGGRFRADYVWRDDVAAVVCDAAIGCHQGVVNVGSGCANSVLEVARLLIDLFGMDPGLIVIEATSQQERIPGFAAVDITRARDWFGVRPVLLRDGLNLWFGAEARKCESP